jgi:hypothetical protein
VGLQLKDQSKWAAFKNLDWTGVFLVNTAIILLLVGIGIGGVTFPWKHAGVIVPIVIACVLFGVFWTWEAKFAKQPFMAKQLFVGKTRTFTMFLIVDFVAGMGLYAAAAFWAQLVRGMWQGDPIKVMFNI